MSGSSHDAPGTSRAVPSGDSRREQVCHVIDHAAHLLPAQGPIGVFVHHNTLHAFQHLPFEQAVVEASRIFGTEPFLTEAEYQAQRRLGRILDEDIDVVLSREPDAEILPGSLTRHMLRRAMLIPGVRHFSAENIDWLIDECGLLERLRGDIPADARDALLAPYSAQSEASAAHELMAVCFARTPAEQPPSTSNAPRPHDGIRARTGIDSDTVIHPWLIRLCSVFVDQGLSYWPMPERGCGFYVAVRELIRRAGFVEPDLLLGIQDAFADQAAAGLSAVDVVLSHLDRFHVQEPEWEALIAAELLALPGWAGLFRQLEEAPELAPYEEVPCSLVDFLAVRLTFTDVVVRNVVKRTEAGDLWSSWRTLPPPPPISEAEHLATAAVLFDIAQILGLSAERLRGLSAVEFGRFAGEAKQFHDTERRRLLQLAYERRHEQMILQPLRAHRQSIRLDPKPPRPAAQVMFCIDEREESMRRALEEIDPEVETHGAAGFFGVAVQYRGLDDPRGVALCPVVVTPQHAVVERPRSERDAELYTQRQLRRKLWSDIARGTVIGSRMLVRGWIGTMGLGLISLIPLITRVLAPRTAARVYQWLSERFFPVPSTDVTLLRQSDELPQATDDLLLGFSIEEKADRVAAVLRPAGMVENLARIVVVLGHGSTTRNNPHESAYCCGACGGRSGAPNARLFAAMANRPEVRAVLRERGLSLPEDTWFVGGYHDTCSDAVEYADTEHLPPGHRADFERISASLERARAANALERSRRFEAAWKTETPESALRHVQERSEHLAEPRPEFGHATNAVCVVGRRAITRGLFLDRRSFLVSYDPDLDPENQSLAALLAAGGPVCAGINLEYYFSTVDNEGYGCGTKLPHNVASLVGVMNGAVSDLRTGLPRQTVEIHEPVRLLLIVETTPERLLNAAASSALVTELVVNRWIRVATVDPDSGEIHVFRDGEFERLEDAPTELPTAPTSWDWFRGRQEHLPVARIGREPARTC